MLAPFVSLVYYDFSFATSSLACSNGLLFSFAPHSVPRCTRRVVGLFGERCLLLNQMLAERTYFDQSAMRPNRAYEKRRRNLSRSRGVAVAAGRCQNCKHTGVRSHGWANQFLQRRNAASGDGSKHLGTFRNEPAHVTGPCAASRQGTKRRSQRTHTLPYRSLILIQYDLHRFESIVACTIDRRGIFGVAAQCK